jgi:hypothetical protein
LTVTTSVSAELSVPSLTVSVRVYEPAALKVALVAAVFVAENAVAAVFDELQAYVKDEAGPSSVAEPLNETVAFGNVVDVSAPALTVGGVFVAGGAGGGLLPPPPPPPLHAARTSSALAA